jgi:hypothetical protein
MSRHKIFSLPTRVYFQDTDAGGVVYHGSYVNFMERARTEWLRDVCGFSNGALMKEFGVVFVVRSMKVEYLKPALLDDMPGDADADREARRGIVDRRRSTSGVCGTGDVQAGERAGSIAREMENLSVHCRSEQARSYNGHR